MQTNEFEYLAGLIEKHSGIELSSDKGYLVESRLLPVAQRFGCSSVAALIELLKNKGGGEMEAAITEAMATVETSFFRDKHVFEAIADTLLPDVLEMRAAKQRLSIWCAGVSTGQEAYSLAMLLKEAGPQMPNWKVKIKATDLSRDALIKAEAGVYSQFEVQRGLPIQHLIRYFDQKGETWTIDPMIRSMVKFEHHNLMDDLSPLGEYDIVFLRNVANDFSKAARHSLYERLGDVLAPDGYLVLGTDETPGETEFGFRAVDQYPGLYQRDISGDRQNEAQPAA